MQIITDREVLKEYLGPENESMLFNLYDGYVRVVDPETNKVEVTTQEPAEIQSNPQTTCFEIWHKNKVCSNCTSLRALVNNEPITKMETKDNLVYLVHSLPFNLPNGRKAVLEVIKKLTKGAISSDIRDYPDPDFIALLGLVDRLNKRVYRDALTNVFNREYLNVKLPNLISRDECTILMVDIDNFKRINAQYGLPAGDAVLRQCVDIVSANSREYDEIIRYDSDKLIIVLNNLSEERAGEIRRRLEQAFKDNHLIEYENESISYNVSIGSYPVKEGEAGNLEQIVKRAEEAMYMAKRRKYKQKNYQNNHEKIKEESFPLNDKV